jgi:large repetitive protein
MRRVVLLAVLALGLLGPASAFASAYGDAVTASTPSDWWRLGESSGTTAADTAGLSPGTWSGSIGLGVGGALAGDADGAASMSGSGGLTLGTGYNPAAAFTLEAWANLAVRNSTRYVLSKGTTTTGMHLYAVSGIPTLRVSTSSTTATLSAPAAPAAGTWHHLAATFGAGTATLYVDGVAVKTVAVAGTLRTSPLALTAGRYSGSSSNQWTGRLDELAVYDRALTGAELAAHATAGLDTAAAATSVAAGPPARTDDRHAGFTLAGTDPQAVFTCALDGAAPAACTSTPSYNNLPDAPHALLVAGTDRWGRPATAASYTWTVDQTAAPDWDPNAPGTSIAASVRPATAQTDATFTLTASRAPATFACALDGGAFAACPATVAYRNLAGGDHALRVRATDRFGHVATDAATFAWTIDRTPPDTALALIGAGPAGGPMAAFAGTEPGSFECKLGDAGWSPCTSPLALPAGTTTLSVRALDAAGNADPAPATARLTTTAASEPTGAATFTSTGATIPFAVSSGGTPECRLDGGAWGSCGSPAALAGLAWGEHVWELRATFANGLHLDAPAQRWTVAAPGARIAALQFPVLLHRSRSGRALARGRTPSLRFALNVAVPVRVSVQRVRGRKARSMGVWTVAESRGDHVVRLPAKLLGKLKRGRYRIAAQPAGGAAARVAFAVV